MATKLDTSLKDLLRKGAFNDKKVKQDFRALIERQFRRAHDKLMNSFDKHPVTRELKGGAGGNNVTGTLGSGNLFGFIGFNSNDDPINQLRKILSKANILIHKSNRRTFTHTFRVHIATLEEMYELTPLPWAQGASWLQVLEGRGIPNLGQYAFKESENSRSGAGIQTDKSGGGTLKISYLKPILKQFERDVSSMAGFKIK